MTPYGRAAWQLGLAAFDALYDLSIEPDQWEGRERQWVESDRLALQGWSNIESEIPHALADSHVSRDQRLTLNRLLHTYHGSLPFSEAEREWLHEIYDTLDSSDRPGIIRQRAGEVVSSGLHCVVSGDDLMRRWWSWRRGADEFSDQATVRVAREALQQIVEAVAPDLGLPETYRDSSGIMASRPD
jgi:hypothetical protein